MTEFNSRVSKNEYEIIFKTDRQVCPACENGEDK